VLGVTLQQDEIVKSGHGIKQIGYNNESKIKIETQPPKHEIQPVYKKSACLIF
jgi:hypothetical protein